MIDTIDITIFKYIYYYISYIYIVRVFPYPDNPDMVNPDVVLFLSLSTLLTDDIQEIKDL